MCGGVCRCVYFSDTKKINVFHQWTAVYHLFDFSSQSGFILEYITKALLNKIDSGFQKTNSQCWFQITLSLMAPHVKLTRRCFCSQLRHGIECVFSLDIERSWVRDYPGANSFITYFWHFYYFLHIFYTTNLFSPNLTWDNVVLLGIWFS